MAQAKNGDTVRIHYTGKLNDGTEFNSSAGHDPMEFTLGEGSVIPGFEEAVVGMNAGDKKTIEIASDDAYGPRHEEGVQEIERSTIPDEIELKVGAQLQATAPDGNAMMLVVTALNDTHVTMDANHPLAGHDLTFNLELVEIV